MAFNQQLLLWEECDNLCPCCIIHTVLQLIMTFTSNHIAFKMKTFWSVKQVRPELISLMQKKLICDWNFYALYVTAQGGLFLSLVGSWCSLVILCVRGRALSLM